MMRFAVCDDEPLMSQEIQNHLLSYLKEKNISDYQVSSFSGGCALLESGGSFDVIFLDIQMEQPDGLETARLLRRQGCRSLLIFVTVLKECVFDAFEVEAYDYLLKPVEAGRFRRTMDRALKRLGQPTEKSIVIQRGTGCEVVLLSEIVYCEVQGRKIYLHRADGTVIDYYDRLEELERQVDRRFFKCHRSYLVNLKHLKGCKDNIAYLDDGSKVPVSRLRSREFSDAILHYMKDL